MKSYAKLWFRRVEFKLFAWCTTYHERDYYYRKCALNIFWIMKKIVSSHFASFYFNHMIYDKSYLFLFPFNLSKERLQMDFHRQKTLLLIWIWDNIWDIVYYRHFTEMVESYNTNSSHSYSTWQEHTYRMDGNLLKTTSSNNKTPSRKKYLPWKNIDAGKHTDSYGERRHENNFHAKCLLESAYSVWSINWNDASNLHAQFSNDAMKNLQSALNYCVYG